MIINIIIQMWGFTLLRDTENCQKKKTLNKFNVILYFTHMDTKIRLSSSVNG